MLVTLAALTVTSVQLMTAELNVQLDADTAFVTAEYAFAEAVEAVTFRAIRLRGQVVSVISSTRPLLSESDGGISRWRDTSPRSPLTIEYSVAPYRDRVALIVPDQPSIPGVTDIQIRVHGLSRDVSLVDGLPRMVRRDDGTVVSTPANLPSFLLLPTDRVLPVARVADAIVLGLLVIGSAFWLVRRTSRAP